MRTVRFQVAQQDLESARAGLNEPIPAEFGGEDLENLSSRRIACTAGSLDVGFGKINGFWTQSGGCR
jgi:hypothetical protein